MDEREELLEEEVSAVEVREVLRRLERLVPEGPDRATIAALAEATGQDPEVIGRLVAEIRNPPAKYVEYPRPHLTESRYEPFNYPNTGVDPESPDERRRGSLQRSLLVILTVGGTILFLALQPVCIR